MKYGIRWPEGNVTVVGESREYAEQLLGEASGPFPAHLPSPTIVEIFTCPWCGTNEPNEFLLQNNHWVKPEGHTGYDWCQANGMCIAQSLTQNHVSYDCARLGHPILARNNQPDRPTTKKGRAAAIAQLRRDIERAAQLWSHRDDADWLDDARQVLLIVDPPAPTHHDVQVADDDTALFEVTL